MAMITREQHFSQNARDPHWLAAIIISICLIAGGATAYYVKAHPDRFPKGALAATAAKPRSCSQEFAAYRRAARDIQLNLREIDLGLPFELCQLDGQCEGEQGLRFILGNGKTTDCLGCVPR